MAERRRDRGEKSHLGGIRAKKGGGIAKAYFGPSVQLYMT